MKAKGKATRLTPDEIAVFCSQMAMLLQAGINLADGMPSMVEDMQKGPLKQVADRVAQQVQAGAPLEAAMEQTGAFPDYVIHTAQIGSEAGRLDEVMLSLAEYYEREQAIRSRLHSAVLYPAMLFCMMAVVVVVLVTKVLPMFDSIFRQLGGEMSKSATALMRLGTAFGRYAFVILLVLVALGLACAVAARTAWGKRTFSRLFARFPFTRGLAQKMAARRFASAMALMLSSGVEIQRSFDLCAGLVGNDFIGQRIELCKRQIAQGQPFADALRSSQIFPGLFSQMVGLGFQTGSADTVMQKLADLYEEQIDTGIANITSIVEPVLVAVLSIVIGIILISVMLPLAGIMSSIG